MIKIGGKPKVERLTSHPRLHRPKMSATGKTAFPVLPPTAFTSPPANSPNTQAFDGSVQGSD